MKSIRNVAQYHADRIRETISHSDPLTNQFRIKKMEDMQAAKLMFALDIRRLAELLVVAGAWESHYQGDEEELRNVGMNDFIDIFTRENISKDTSEYVRHFIKSITHKRFKKKYKSASEKTNEQMRRDANSIFQFAFSVSSKIIHADEYSVQNHSNNDSLAWPCLIMAASLLMKEYANWSGTQNIE